jgi:hypothetical protein
MDFSLFILFMLFGLAAIGRMLASVGGGLAKESAKKGAVSLITSFFKK